MRVFVAGSTGAIGRFLVPLLVEAGHQVVTLVHTPEKAPTVEAFGAEAAVADALDRAELTAAVTQAQPDVIIHQLTAITGVGNLKKLDEDFALTNRLHTEATDTLLGAKRSIATRCPGLSVKSPGLREHRRVAGNFYEERLRGSLEAWAAAS